MKALVSTISALFGMCVGTMCSHPEAVYYWVHLKYLQVPIIAGFLLALIVLERSFLSFSSKVMATTWAAAFCTYLSKPATKIFVKAPISKEEYEMYTISFGIGFIITWYLFFRSQTLESVPISRSAEAEINPVSLKNTFVSQIFGTKKKKRKKKISKSKAA